MISRISNHNTTNRAQAQRKVAFGDARHTVHFAYLTSKTIATDLKPQEEQKALLHWIKAIVGGHVEKQKDGSFLNKLAGDAIKITKKDATGTRIEACNRYATEKVDFWTHAQTDSTMNALHKTLINDLEEIGK